MHLNGENWDLKGKTCRIWVNSKENLDSAVGLPLPRSIIHVYNHNIQRFSSLKPPGQSKSNFIGNICMKGEPV